MKYAVWLIVIGAAGVWYFFLRDDPAPPPPARENAVDRIGRFPRSQFYIEHDRFLPANEPATVPAAQASFLRHDDEVFGVVVRGQARAYPVTMISYHHVVNDLIRGIPIAVTY